MPSLAPLVLFRFLGGAGAAAVILLAIAWIGDVVPYERRQALLARYISGQILGIVFGQAAGGLFGELIGWRATLLMLGVLHIGAGLLLFRERRWLGAGAKVSGQPRWIEAARAASSLLRQPWVRVVLISVFIEGMAMFGALAYVGADLHVRFGLGLGMVGAFLVAFGAGASRPSRRRAPSSLLGLCHIGRHAFRVACGPRDRLSWPRLLHAAGECNPDGA